MRENLMSGSMWQGMETRQGDGTEALSQETESNGSATPKLWRHPLTLPADGRGCARPRVCARKSRLRIRQVSPCPPAAEPHRWAATCSEGIKVLYEAIFGKLHNKTIVQIHPAANFVTAACLWKTGQ